MIKRSQIDRRALFASGAAAALLAATGLSAQPSPTRGGRLRLALSGATRGDGFNMLQSHGLFMNVAMVGAVFDTLTEVAADGTLRGELATSWRSDSHATIWDLQLRQDVWFHDGTPFSAEDVIASLAIHKAHLTSDVVEMTSDSSFRLKLVLAESDPDFPYRLSDPRLLIYPSASWESAIANGIGTGLYRVHKFQPGRHFIGQRVESHYKDGRAGWFDSVECVALSSDAVRAEALRESFVDAADLTHLEDLGNLDTIRTLPEANFMTMAVDHRVALPQQIGRRWPMDNFRAAERWWMA